MSQHLTISSNGTFSCGRLALGVFDGFHLGHQQLAKKADSLLSIFPHPKTIVRNEECDYLSFPEERLALFKQSYILEFTVQVAALSAQDFLAALHSQLSPTGYVVGYDFRFGSDREGDARFLKQWCLQHKLSFECIDCYKLSNKAVKSGYIRTLINEGDFNRAVEMLGHPYLIRGCVIKGDGRGKNLGFPTANLKLPKTKCCPQPGVYGAYISIQNQKRVAIVYIGSKPTFEGSACSVEVHIPGFNGDLYGQSLNVYLTGFIRSEQQFSSSHELISQIQRDIATLSDGS